MALKTFKEPYLEFTKKARSHIQDNEFNYLILNNELEEYCFKLEELKDKDLITAIKQYQQFNQVHDNIKINDAAIQASNPNTTDIPLFDKTPNLRHLNLIKGKVIDPKKKVEPNPKEPVKVEFSIPESNMDPTYSKHVWTLPSFVLFRKNSTLFNTLLDKYKPLTSMIFHPSEKHFEDKKKREYASLLQYMVQSPDDLDTLFNALENQQDLFTFPEVYMFLKNSLSSGSPSEMKILKSKTMKSWFGFISSESKVNVSLTSKILAYGGNA